MRFAFVILLGLAAPLAMAAGPPDPTRPPSDEEIRAWFGEPGHETDGSRQWQLQSVLIGEQRSTAIINDQRVSTGDTVDRAEVVAIEPGVVILRHAGDEIRLTIQSFYTPR